MQLILSRTLTLVVMTLALQGCARETPASPDALSVKALPSDTSASLHATEDNNGTKKLEKCMFEASQLTEASGGKYAGKKEQLYKTISEAKYYATVAGKVSSETENSMTPYYQFKINDICNDIAWTMYNELKAGNLTLPASR